MAGYYAYTPQIWLPVCAALLAAVLGAYALRQRHVPGAREFGIAVLFGVLWVVGEGAELAAVDLATKVWWYKFEVIWQMPVATAVACFTFEYAWPGRWLSRRNVALLSLPPVVTAVLIVTNDRHNLVWSSLTHDGAIAPVRASASELMVAYVMVIALLQAAALVWLYWRSPEHRWPAGIILGVLLANRAIYIVGASGGTADQRLPIASVIVGLSAVSHSIAIFGFRILDPVARAPRAAVAQMKDGLLVVDPDGCVATINPAAQSMLGVSAGYAVGRAASSLLPWRANEGEPVPDAPGGPAEIALGSGPTAKTVLVASSELRDWRDVISGRLLLLRDVTEERRAQAKILEQQRALATLAERGRLARELHDSLGQTLAAAHFQVGTARRLLDRGLAAEADACLQGLSDMTLAAEVDIREYILGARRTTAVDQPFVAVLRDYVGSYARRFDIVVILSAPVDLEQSGFDAIVEAQLLRIIQEALSNVRKHARAGQVEIDLAVTGSTLRVVVADDGQGFNRAAVTARVGDGFGLDTMRERAESIGGSLEVAAAPGQGTRVTVTVPVEGNDMPNA